MVPRHSPEIVIIVCKIITRFRKNISETYNTVVGIVFQVNAKGAVLTFALEIFDGKKKIAILSLNSVPHISVHA